MRVGLLLTGDHARRVLGEGGAVLEAVAARKLMGRACKLGKIPHFSPKNLRERRASIWHHGGVVAKTLAERLGHSKASISLDVYTHTLDPGEVAVEDLVARLN